MAKNQSVETETVVEFENDPAAVTEAPKPKRVRKVAPKVQLTGTQIVEKINALHEEVKSLSHEVGQLDHSSAIHAIADKVLQDKKAELEKALATIYTI